MKLCAGEGFRQGGGALRGRLFAADDYGVQIMALNGSKGRAYIASIDLILTDRKKRPTKDQAEIGASSAR
jgi:hypothetical protein